ncbi:extracellular solute-binding protein [Ferdinandcohnia quinoae]|uniref:Extracellular solute-binding protein n=1 Tax=Fredinandcohnia quinoae TaxID=2918902 RepID=A0AAW5DVU8_9BACI|nr:extracellular solute-binding protein [Fredinandcohnia sp. SECRCQ15]MCH1624473.1 extracellular solute-binding protein [Fredinandcohnia sp. SECRCQ15]
MKLRKLLLIFVISILSISVIACTSKDTGGKDKDGDKDTANIDPFDHTEKYTITGMTFRFGDPPPLKSPGLDMINERFNIDYKPEIIPQGDYTEKSSAIVAGGSMPDLVGFQAGDSRFYQWAEEGAFLPLDDYLKHYKTLGGIPDSIYNAFKVNGHIYGIPRYTNPYPLTPIVRKDWLENLGLELPTNYEELKEIAIAFTNDDPDQNGEKDTYGVAIGENINPNFNMGAYWDFNSWYHQNDEGQYIPGIISEGRKELVQFFADLYAANAMTKDFAVLNWADTNGEFYSGKAGIFIGGVSGMSEDYMSGLLDIDPEAEFVAIPPFEAPDGSVGFTRGSGNSGILALNAKLADDPGKIYRALELVDFGKTYFAKEERNPDNADFDWMWGKEGVGYNMEDGSPVYVSNFSSDGLSPSTYFLDNREHVPSDAAIKYADDYSLPAMKALVDSLQQMFESNKMYVDPANGVISQVNQEKGTDLTQFVMNEQAKMIAGQRSVSDWDQLVEEYLQRGGADLIKEMNEGIKEKGYTDRVWE